MKRASAIASFVLVLAWTTWVRADALGDVAGSFRTALDSGNFITALLFIFIAGLATSLTPCVYPMIVITVSVFGARQAHSRLEGAMLSSLFVLGMAALFTPLGLLAATTGSVFGEALASRWVLAGLSILFIALAASMLGAFDVALPAKVQNRLAQMGGRGYRGAFALGLVSAVIAAPCTGPVLAALLAWVAQTGHVVYGGLSLFTYALGLGVLFWVVGTFAVGLPKSGRWLLWVKSGFGIVLLTMAGYYLKDVVPIPWPHERTDVLLYASGALLLLGLAGGAVGTGARGQSTVARLRWGAAVAATVVGLSGAVAWLEALPPGSKIAWNHDWARARAQALEEGKPFFVDFGADWCKECLRLERSTLSDPRVVAESRRFVAIKVDMSAGKLTPGKRDLLASYNERGLPLMVLHDRDGRERGRVLHFVEPADILDLLQRTR